MVQQFRRYCPEKEQIWTHKQKNMLIPKTNSTTIYGLKCTTWWYSANYQEECVQKAFIQSAISVLNSGAI